MKMNSALTKIFENKINFRDHNKVVLTYVALTNILSVNNALKERRSNHRFYWSHLKLCLSQSLYMKIIWNHYLDSLLGDNLREWNVVHIRLNYICFYEFFVRLKNNIGFKLSCLLWCRSLGAVQHFYSCYLIAKV